ncbi:DUF3500 domain-containing protein [Deinococcus planocerae]|uniref:DUF3500 domain-containing protein n=1 Tax=Deinococcus planocerae TaxID=1737569 RepID=UPI0011AEC7CE|nr:DUF3500 domain-containing protein [Deinococcus planocerae]
MKRSLTLALLIPTAALGAYLASTALAGGAEPTAKATATLQAGGTVTTTGLRLTGQNVTLPARCAGLPTQTAQVVCAANTFLGTLSAAQRAKVLLPATEANAIKWSNLPVAIVPRNGVALGDLSSTQRDAALAVVRAATGSAADEGYSEALQLRLADDVLNISGNTNGVGGGGTPPAGATGTAPAGGPPSGTPPAGAPNGTPPAGGFPAGGLTGNDYGNGLYSLAFLGTPSTTGTWQLQFGGHHLAFNITYKAGQVAGATPKFTGVEPKVWTANGKTYAPMKGEHDTMAAMLAGLSAQQLAAAKLSQTFSDVLLGPNQDGKFPETKVGVRVGTLSAAQKARVLAAIRPWVRDADDATAARLLAVYEKELDQTYISYSGNPTLTKNADYARIDGPSVWIEFACQNGVVYRSQIHYHTIWRDHTRDYGGEYTF